VLVIFNEEKRIMDTRDALQLAKDNGLDLVEVAANRRPPVCKILDYGKMKYDEKKAAAEKKRNQTKIEVKEMKFRPKTDKHDMDFKCKHVRKFLEEGNKCKLTMWFRGRERAHKNIGADVLNEVADRMKDIADVTQRPVVEGNRMTMMLSPRAGVVKKAAMG
jgi:translation initiation factor IF-3